MLAYFCVAIAALTVGIIIGRSDVRAEQRRPVQTVDRVKLVWSNGKRKS